MTYRNPVPRIASTTAELLVCLCLAIFATRTIAADQAEKQLAKRPSSKAISEAVSVAAELYSDRITKAREPVEKVELAQELIRTGKETQDDPAAQFALFYVARNLAVDAENWSLAMAAIAAVVERFLPPGELSPAEQVKRGDWLCDKAKKSRSKKDKLALRLEAAEWYLYAKSAPKKLAGKLAEKRLEELQAAFGVDRCKDADLRLLIGTWEVKSAGGYNARWTFLPDGTVVSTRGTRKGTWSIRPEAVHITWGKKAWDTFHRPLNANRTSGDSWGGKGVVTAIKVVQ